MIPVNIPDIRVEDIDSVREAMEQGWISGEGPIVEKFESAFAEATGRKFGVAVSNGSDALELAFKVLELAKGDEVILPSFTIVSCLAPLLRLGLRPVFVDVDLGTWNATEEGIIDAITDRTRAILLVHTYGLTTNIRPVLNAARERGIAVIEDAAEAHGLEYDGQLCGSFGDISTFSFYANKNVTTGEGGMVLTDDPLLNEKLRYFRNLTFRADRRFVHDALGWNMRLSSLQAALGTSQIARIGENLSKRREIAGMYREGLLDLRGIRFQDQSTPHVLNGYWVFGVVLDNHHFMKDAAQAMDALQQNGVGTRPFFFPLHKQPFLQKDSFSCAGLQTNAETLGNQGFYLPNGLGMGLEKVAEVIEIAKRVLAS